MTPSGPHLIREHDDRSPERARELVGVLFREHYAGLCGFVARYVKSREVAEEVVQEIFLRVWEQCEAADDAVPSRAYLYAAARNQAINLLRHERLVRRHAELASRQPELTGRTTAPDAELEADELSRAAQRAIAGLPERARTVFLLSREGGLSYREIAEVLDISVKTVEANMARALKGLKASLGGGLGALALAVHATLRLMG